jgi:hypothetical protein
MRKYNFWKSDAAIQDIRHAFLLQLMKLNHMKRVSIPQLCVLAYSQKQVLSCSLLQAKNTLLKRLIYEVYFVPYHVILNTTWLSSGF